MISVWNRLLLSDKLLQDGQDVKRDEKLILSHFKFLSAFFSKLLIKGLSVFTPSLKVNLVFLTRQRLNDRNRSCRSRKQQQHSGVEQVQTCTSQTFSPTNLFSSSHSCTLLSKPALHAKHSGIVLHHIVQQMRWEAQRTFYLGIRSWGGNWSWRVRRQNKRSGLRWCCRSTRCPEKHLKIRTSSGFTDCKQQQESQHRLSLWGDVSLRASPKTLTLLWDTNIWIWVLQTVEVYWPELLLWNVERCRPERPELLLLLSLCWVFKYENRVVLRGIMTFSCEGNIRQFKAPLLELKSSKQVCVILYLSSCRWRTIKEVFQRLVAADIRELTRTKQVTCLDNQWRSMSHLPWGTAGGIRWESESLVPAGGRGCWMLHCQLFLSTKWCWCFPRVLECCVILLLSTCSSRPVGGDGSQAADEVMTEGAKLSQC